MSWLFLHSLSGLPQKHATEEAVRATPQPARRPNSRHGIALKYCSHASTIVTPDITPVSATPHCESERPSLIRLVAALHYGNEPTEVSGLNTSQRAADFEAENTFAPTIRLRVIGRMLH